MSDNLTDRLQRTFDRARAASEQRGFIYGTVGRQNENGSHSVVVAGRPNYLYVTVDGEQASTIARAGATPRVAGLPVRMKREQGELVIVDVNQLALGAFLEGGAGGYNVAFHHHNEGSGLEYAVNSSRLKPGRVRFVTALTVHIGEFAYSHAGEWRWWPGGNIDLTSVQPATAGEWAWVLVGVDPETNTAVAAAGAGQATGTPLTVDQIESIAFNGYIPCGAVRVREDDTALNLASRYADARIWLDKLGLLALGDVGDVTLTTPADGEVLTFDSGEWVNAAAPGDVAAAIDGATEKTTPVGADKVGLVDSEAPDAGLLKWISWTNLVAGVQAAIDSVYFRLTGRVGGQVAHGGTASGDSLTLRGSAHATSGGVVVDDALDVDGGVTAVTAGLPGAFRRSEASPSQGLRTALAFDAVRADAMADGYGPLLLFQVEDDGAVANPIAGIGAQRRGEDNSGKLVLATYDGGVFAVKMEVLPDGKVGIGRVPEVRLHLADTVVPGATYNVGDIFTLENDGAANINFIGSSASAVGLLFSDGDQRAVGLLRYVHSTDALEIRTSGTQRFSIASDGRTAIGPSAPATSAKLDIQGTDGALLFPRLTTAQKNALTAANGMEAYDTSRNMMDERENGRWMSDSFARKYAAGVAGTAVTLLPAGTVTEGLHIVGGAVKPSGLNAAVASTTFRLLGGDGILWSTGGATPTDQINLRVNADGSVDVRRMAGSRTYTVALYLAYI